METKLIAAKSELAISAALSCTFSLQNVCLAVARWKMIEAEFGFWGEWQQETTQVLQDPAPPNESTKSRRFGNLAIQIGAHPPNCRSAIERHRCLSCCHIWPSSPQRNRRGDARALSCVEKARKVGWSGAGKGLVSVRLSAGRKWTREFFFDCLSTGYSCSICSSTTTHTSHTHAHPTHYE